MNKTIIAVGLFVFGAYCSPVFCADPLMKHTTEEASAAIDEIHHKVDHDKHHKPESPSLFASLPFVIILLCIALLPLIHKTEHWWHKNKNKLIVAAVLSIITLTYYFLRGVGVPHGGHLTDPGLSTVQSVLVHAVLNEYIPFIVLLFSLYTISGGIQLRGDLKATPFTNTSFLAVGAGLASFIGTTGASMLLIRPLLQTNQERKHVRHTVLFFIFLVSNIGGSLLPIGDPPLFLGYLRGVPFLWTFGLWKYWLFCIVVLLIIYFVWDTIAYKKEKLSDLKIDETKIEPLRIRGSLNFLWLLGVVLAVAFLVPGKSICGWEIKPYVRELAQLFFVVIAWITSARKIRVENEFNFFAILEVAALFIGIFITMQVPIEILTANSESLKEIVSSPRPFFWMTGILSSFLDNAPTYAVFFELASSMTTGTGKGVLALSGGGHILESWLVAISLGAVFMGANSYIGNGPNFMVKSIAEQSGIKMPSFFGYMIYSVGILVPVFLAVTFFML